MRPAIQKCFLEPIHTSYGYRLDHLTSPLTIRFEIFPFFPLSACLTLCPHCLHSDLPCPSLSMNHTPGPWSLQKVKNKLRREQVERELAASERYRQLEAKRNEQTIGGQSWSNCILIVLVSCCFLLLALLFAAVLCIVFLWKKDNEER
jgi:hypothetical protein